MLKYLSDVNIMIFSVFPGSTMAQYFIEVVPTDVYTFLSHTKAFQYSVKENIRPIGKYRIR